MTNKEKKINYWMGASFTPLALSPLAWWDNGATYMAADGSSWTDRIGGLNFASLGTAPTFTANVKNNRPGFTFNGTNQRMSRARLTQIEGQTGLTIWSVGVGNAIEQKGSSQWIAISDTSGDFYILPNSNAGYGMKTSTRFQINYDLLVYDGTLTGNANRLKFYRNGVQQTLTFTGTVAASITADVTASLFLNSFTGTATPGTALEHGIINRAITSVETTSLNTYLSGKYAITGDTQNVYFYGDSFTSGSGVTAAQRWTTLVSGTRGWNEINNGVAGTPLESAVPVNAQNLYDARATILTKKVNDKYIVISHHINDAIYSAANPATYTTAVFTTQYQAIIDTIVSKGWAKADIVMQMGWYSETYDPTIYANYLAAGISLGSTNGCLFVDQTGTYGHSGLQGDLLHPNATGHAAIATKFLSLVS